MVFQDLRHMATSNFAPQDLGRRAELDASRLEPGVILWERFCIVDKGSERVIPVTDLERVFGQQPGYLLELHLLDIPKDAEGRSRLRRAISLDNRTQQRVYATIETGTSVVLICDPVGGRNIDRKSVV